MSRLLRESPEEPDPVDLRLADRLIESLTDEALRLEAATRAYFKDSNGHSRRALTPIQRMRLACESLRITTRLLHILIWLSDRPVMPATDRDAPRGRLCAIPASDEAAIAQLPETARILIRQSNALYSRIHRLDRGIDRHLALVARLPDTPPPRFEWRS